MSEPASITIRGAREHNLKGVDLDVPRHALVVFTGVSGSGKSSLAFDTIHQEGQRRFMESLSAYARQFLGQMEKPKVDAIDGLSPTVCIDQKTVNRNPRSTVGTVTEIYDHLRLLMARLGTPHCPECGRAIARIGVDAVVDQILAEGRGKKVQILGPMVRERKGEYRKELDELKLAGWARVRVDGEIKGLDEPIELARYEKHTIEVVVDRLVPDEADRARLTDAVETATKLGKGICGALIAEGDGDPRELVFATDRACPKHPEVAVPELEPRLFSFNAPQGACTACNGLGAISGFDVTRLVDLDKPATEAYLAFGEEGRVPFTWFDRAALGEVVKLIGGPAKKALKDWPADALKRLIHGDPELMYSVAVERSDGRTETRERPWAGLLGMVENVWKWTQHAGLQKFRSDTACVACAGTRLNPIARCVTFRDKPIHHFTSMSVATAFEVFSALTLDPSESLVGSGLVAEIRDRLTFLHEVGLDYLSLDRSSATLSGGEAQRIRLAAQVGSALQGVTYVLDEPSIGLHPRDNKRLLQALFRLRDRGNTVIVVEHDQETIAAADHVVDVGPGAGREGGTIVAFGTPAEIAASNGPTGRWLRGEATIPLPKKRRKPDGAIRIKGATLHNLRDVSADFPLGVLVAVTGVSGSGKSTLTFEVLEASLRARLEGDGRPVGCKSIDGIDAIEKVITIEQTPIGRTPRSNPATYTGAFDLIRDLFAATEEARARGYKKGRFSFNVAGGRCEACEGAGVKTIEMQFLPSVEVPCDICEGRRFNAETLEIRYKGKTIYEVLEMQISEAVEFFAPVPKLARMTRTMLEVGLGYVSLGQPATTLSGGEAQRLKIATELQRPQPKRHAPGGKTVYLLDEPTTGLHFQDVQILVDALQRLVDAGHSVIVVEHHQDVIKCADHIIDMGPEGGSGGGFVTGVGVPEKIARLDTPTGRALQALPEFGGDAMLLAADSTVRYVPTRGPRELTVLGARTHNLQGVDARVPHGTLTVITGPSGSGKTSLALDTLFAEGQRRYVESLSTYARRFLGRMERASVDKVDGLAPAIAIDQHATSHNPRSTVATVTEIHDALRILYAKVGEPHCPVCDRALEALPPTIAAARLRRLDPGAGWLVCELPPADDGEQRCRELIAAGYTRLLGRHPSSASADASSASVEVELESRAAPKLVKEGPWLVIDRFDPAKVAASRATEAIEAAHRLGKRVAKFVPRDRNHSPEIWLPADATCPDHPEHAVPELTPRHFSFNSRIGACPTCEGLGIVVSIAPDKVLVEPSKPFWDAIDPQVATSLRRSTKNTATINALLTHLGILKTPAAKWTKAQRDAVLSGSPKQLDIQWTETWGKITRNISETRLWIGIAGHLANLPDLAARLAGEATCPTCKGGRLRPALLAVKLGGLGIHQLGALPASDAHTHVANLRLVGERRIVAERPLEDVERRLRFLCDVGLGYLALDRVAGTLSGGEAQRIRLASQLGTGLTGCVYVLDEPTIGLHPRDTDRLLATLFGLRDLGNTVIVVEHDPETIRQADHVIDMGPGAGRYGGHILATGSPAEIAANPDSPTGRWLAGTDTMPQRSKRRDARAWIRLKSPTGNNLRCGDVEIPTGVWVAITGPSGSGKSTLVMDTLAPALSKLAGNANAQSSPHGGLTTGDKIDRVVVVDQAPIGRTPRSTPATYVGAMDPLRALFAETPAAKERGFGPGRFSFNAAGGRCEVCEGRGATLVEMHFLPDVWVPCSACNSRRYNRETLEVRFRGRTIADVLGMRADEALDMFDAHRILSRPIRAMVDVGLGYIGLGQPGNTLSGGEAQRVKLAAELGARKGHVVYVLDEPTTGLHPSDVKKLVEVLHKLVDAGHTVITVEHHLDLIGQADWVLDLGPDGGAAGGLLLAAGPPEAIVAAGTATGVALQRNGIGSAKQPAKRKRKAT